MALRPNLMALAGASGGTRAELAEPAAAARATGYIIVGISPHGQRRRLPTVYVSGGRRRLELELVPADLARLTEAIMAPIVG